MIESQLRVQQGTMFMHAPAALVLFLALCFAATAADALRSKADFPAGVRTVYKRLTASGAPVTTTLRSMPQPAHASPRPRGTFAPGKYRSFEGLNAYEAEYSGGYRQPGISTPDQGLCVGNGFVLETINGALRVFNASTGAPLVPPVSMNDFHGYRSFLINPIQTDPSCAYDPAARCWFHVVLISVIVALPGRPVGRNHLEVGVSTTADPTGSWYFYKVPVQNDGTEGTFNHGCNSESGACFGDFPRLGLDAHGLYITTNEFGFASSAYERANILALPKRALLRAAAAVRIAEFMTDRTPSQAPGGTSPGYSICPALYAGDDLPSWRRGEVHFLSTDFGRQSAHAVLLWTLSNTAALSSDAPLTNSSLALRATLLPLNRRLDVPPPAPQPEAGGLPPLGECLVTDGCVIKDVLLGEAYGGSNWFERVQRLDSGELRVLSACYAAGRVWAVAPVRAAAGRLEQPKASVFWISVNPARPAVSRSGVVPAPGSHIIIPSIALNAGGRGAIAFSLVGGGRFPSAAYVPFSAGDVGEVVIPGEGRGLSDGFSGYYYWNSFADAVRWGDYGAAVVDEDGAVWAGSQYISQTCTLAQLQAPPKGTCNYTRTSVSNWATRITKIL